MSKRSQEKRINTATKTLKFLRIQSGLSTQKAAKVAGIHYGTVNHLENGRVSIKEHHLNKLLAAYKVTKETFELFSSGKVAIPKSIKAECIELINQMTEAQLNTVYPVLASLSKNRF